MIEKYPCTNDVRTLSTATVGFFIPILRSYRGRQQKHSYGKLFVDNGVFIALFSNISFTFAMAGEKDSRVVVGGTVWARAEAISRDFKRILGNQFKTKWIHGKVVRVEKRKASEHAKRSTTYVEGKYPCGINDATKEQLYKIKWIPLQSLKAKDPFEASAADVPATVNQAADSTTDTTIENNAPPAANVQGTADPATPPVPEEGNNVTTQAAPATQATQGSTETANSSSTGSSRTPVVTCNDRHWYEGNCNVEVNGKHSSRYWKLQDQYGRGTEFTPGCDRGKAPSFKPIDFFLAVFPKLQLRQMQERTSIALMNAEPKALQPTTIGEILKFLGVLLTITRYEFGLRSSLWTTKGFTRLVPPPNLGEKTGMSRERFDSLWRYMVWSEQPKVRPEGMSHEEWRWSLVQDFVNNFNDHREMFFFPSNLLCADESISRWYGLGGNWINMGLPHYVAMDRKPEHGCEIQNCCDGISGIMLRLKLVKSQAAEEALGEMQRQAVAAAHST